MLKYASALALVLAAAPAFAQSGSTQSPPAPNASSSAPTPATSAPAGAMTLNPSSPANPNVGGPIGATSTDGAPATTSGSPPAAGVAGTVPTPAVK